MLQKKFFLKIIFIIYLLVLTKIILFKYPSEIIWENFKMTNFSMIRKRFEMANFVPFVTISNYLNLFSSFPVAKINILANVLAFAPLGFFTPLTFKNFSKIRQILILSLFLSLSYEFIQLVFGIGTFDVDDLILNLLGTLLGVFCFYLGKLFCKIKVQN